MLKGPMMLLYIPFPEAKDFVTLVKAFSEVCAEWESIADFLLPSETADQFKRRYRRGQ